MISKSVLFRISAVIHFQGREKSKAVNKMSAEDGGHGAKTHHGDDPFGGSDSGGDTADGGGDRILFLGDGGNGGPGTRRFAGDTEDPV